MSRAPGKVQLACVSDDGSRIVVLGQSAHLWFLDADFNVVADRKVSSDTFSMAIDPHGRFVAVSARLGETLFFSRHGRPAGRLDTPQALAHMVFIPRPALSPRSRRRTTSG